MKQVWLVRGKLDSDQLWMSPFKNINFYRYIVMEVGEPAQLLEVTVDMLSPDWYHIMTSSGKGSKYDTFMSSSHSKSSNTIVAR